MRATYLKSIKITLDWHELAALSWAVNDAENVLSESIDNYATCGGMLSELSLYQTVGQMRLTHWKTELMVKLTKQRDKRTEEFSLTLPSDCALMMMRWYLHSGAIDDRLRRVMARIDQKLQGTFAHYNPLIQWTSNL